MKKEVKIKLSNWLAKEKKLPLEIQGTITEETVKAVKVGFYTTVYVWLPKSQITIETTEKQGE